MDVCLLHICLLLLTISDLKISALVVRAVAAADKLFEFSLVLFDKLDSNPGNGSGLNTKK